MSKTFYVTTPSISALIHSNPVERESSTTDPGTGSPSEVQVSVLGSAVDQLCFAFYSPSGEPNTSSWPDGSAGDKYECQADVATAGANLSYGTYSGSGGHFGRVDDLLSADIKIGTGGNSQSGTGIKTIFAIGPTESGFFNTGGTASDDRYEVLIGCDNNSMMAETLGININTSNTFLKGPWVEAPAVERVPRFTPYPQILAH